MEAQIQYIRDQHAPDAAERLRTRVLLFLEKQIALFPRSGRKIESSELWESWIPGTKLIVWYEIGEERVKIISIWHAAQNRSGASAP